MDSRHEGRLIVFSVGAAAVALGGAALAYVAGASRWLSAVVTMVLLIVLILAARRAQTRRWGFGRRSWRGEYRGRSMEVVFDERLVFLNRLTLVVDGQQVDQTTIWYGTKLLRGDGITVEVGSGWIGECTGVEVRSPEGPTVALPERG